jgi:hypothetical protein
MVRCGCGELFDIETGRLLRGATTKCRKCSNHQEYKIGDTFDHLTIEGFTKDKRRRALCRCSCGNLVDIRPELLRINMTNNCGCQPRGNWAGVGGLSGTFLCHIKRNAKTRNIPFDITLEEIWNLFLQQKSKCALTGLPIFINRDPAKTSTASLDRIDSSKGYKLDNVQWLHKDINKMKMDFTPERFLELCRLVTRAQDQIFAISCVP